MCKQTWKRFFQNNVITLNNNYHHICDNMSLKTHHDGKESKDNDNNFKNSQNETRKDDNLFDDDNLEKVENNIIKVDKVSSSPSLGSSFSSCDFVLKKEKVFLHKHVICPILNWKIYKQIGLDSESILPKILLYGHSGVGKTHLCNWICNELNNRNKGNNPKNSPELKTQI